MSTSRYGRAGLKHFASKQCWQRSACIDVSWFAFICILSMACLRMPIPHRGCFLSTRAFVSWWQSPAKVSVAYRMCSPLQVLMKSWTCENNVSKSGTLGIENFTKQQGHPRSVPVHPEPPAQCPDGISSLQGGPRSCWSVLKAGSFALEPRVVGHCSRIVPGRTPCFPAGSPSIGGSWRGKRRPLREEGSLYVYSTFSAVILLSIFPSQKESLLDLGHNLIKEDLLQIYHLIIFAKNFFPNEISFTGSGRIFWGITVDLWQKRIPYCPGDSFWGLVITISIDSFIHLIIPSLLPSLSIFFSL